MLADCSASIFSLETTTSKLSIIHYTYLHTALIFAVMLHHFYPTGRLSRWPYFWRVPALYLLAFACYGMPALAEYQFHTTASLWKNLALAGMALCFYLMFVQVAKRLHDLNMRAWWALMLLLPVASIVLGGGLEFVKGTTGPNRFGPDPLALPDLYSISV